MSFFSDFSYNWQVMPSYQKYRIFGSIGIIIVLGVVLYGFFLRFSGNSEDQGLPVAIEVWDVFDREEYYLEVFSNFNGANPNVFVNYRKIPPELYRQTVTEALAEGEGPDIYMINNAWLPLELRRLAPMNEFLPEINPALVLNEFPDVVRFDFTREGSAGVPLIYALPPSIDTLVLYYNTDYFNSESIVNPPSTLEELIEYSKRLRRIDAEGNIQLAGIAMGSANNVSHSTDILSLLMLQSGTQMNASFDESATLDQPVRKGEDLFFPGAEAMKFYTSFSDPASENYTWNSASEDSMDAFINGRAAMMINYAHQRDTIRKENPALKFKIAPMPQPADRLDRVNYANYWGLAVSKASQNPKAAWDLIRYLTQEENARIYLRASGRPPALKSLIGNTVMDEEGVEVFDPEYEVYSAQILSARSWIQPDPFEVERILKNAINYVLNAEKTPMSAVSDATIRINSIISL